MLFDPNKYISLSYKDHGRSFEGVDCWGLIYLIYKTEYNIILPTYDTYITSGDIKTVSRTIINNLHQWQAITSPQFSDIIILNIAHQPTHVGFVIDNNKMLHVLQGCNSVIESYNNPMWKKRIFGFVRRMPNE